jgi:hypothetical protein
MFQRRFVDKCSVQNGKSADKSFVGKTSLTGKPYHTHHNSHYLSRGWHNAPRFLFHKASDLLSRLQNIDYLNKPDPPDKAVHNPHNARYLSRCCNNVQRSPFHKASDLLSR